MFDGITILINIILFVLAISSFIILAPNLKILFYSITNTLNVKVPYLKGEFLTFIIFSFFIWLIIYFLYNNDLYYLYIPYLIGGILLMPICMISMVIRFFSIQTPADTETFQKYSFNYKSIYISLSFLFIFTLIYLVSILPFWRGTGYTVLLTLSIINFGFIVWLFIKIFKSNNEESN